MTNVRRKLLAAASAVALTVGLCAGSGVNAEVVVRGIEGKPLEEVRPAPAFFKPDLDIITAQPSPSEVNPCADHSMCSVASQRLTSITVHLAWKSAM
jgi:hypothetical protein